MVPTQVLLLGEGPHGLGRAVAGRRSRRRLAHAGPRRPPRRHRDVRGTRWRSARSWRRRATSQVGDVLRARLEDTTRCRSAWRRSMSATRRLGHVVMDRAVRAAPRRRPRRRGRVRGRRRAIAHRRRRRPPGRAAAHPRAVPRRRPHARVERRLGRLGDHRALDRVRRAVAGEHRGDGHRRAPRRARHHPPAGRDAAGRRSAWSRSSSPRSSSSGWSPAPPSRRSRSWACPRASAASS